MATDFFFKKNNNNYVSIIWRSKGTIIVTAIDWIPLSVVNMTFKSFETTYKASSVFMERALWAKDK